MSSSHLGMFSRSSSSTSSSSLESDHSDESDPSRMTPRMRRRVSSSLNSNSGAPEGGASASESSSGVGVRVGVGAVARGGARGGAGAERRIVGTGGELGGDGEVTLARGEGYLRVGIHVHLARLARLPRAVAEDVSARRSRGRRRRRRLMDLVSNPRHVRFLSSGMWTRYRKFRPTRHPWTYVLLVIKNVRGLNDPRVVGSPLPPSLVQRGRGLPRGEVGDHVTPAAHDSHASRHSRERGRESHRRCASPERGRERTRAPLDASDPSRPGDF